jgi:hypothetical protein
MKVTHCTIGTFYVGHKGYELSMISTMKLKSYVIDSESIEILFDICSESIVFIQVDED